MKTTLKILDKTGDTRIVIDENDPVAIAKAKEAYDEAVKRGSIPVGMKTATDGEKLKSFDDVKQYPEVVMLAPIQGG